MLEIIYASIICQCLGVPTIITFDPTDNQAISLCIPHVRVSGDVEISELLERLLLLLCLLSLLPLPHNLVYCCLGHVGGQNRVQKMVLEVGCVWGGGGE